jgi:hypothetical protein
MTITIFLFAGGHFHWWRKPEDTKKPTDLLHVTDNLALIEIRTHNISGDRQ